MDERQTTNKSMYGEYSKHRRRNKILDKKKELSKNKSSIGIAIGIVLSLVIIVLQCIAFFTPHWKEVAPNANSLYVDGVDALIRTEVLHYFNTIHRYTRHSYGLFQRCEYLLSNSSKYNNQQDLYDLATNKRQSKCTKNYLPSYRDEFFNECHSLPYYRFCTKSGIKNFNIDNDYLRATFDISSHTSSTLVFSCDCHYPSYILVCHIIGAIALLFLFLTSLLYSLFPFFTNPHYRLKIKCFAVLSSILSIIFLMTNLILVFEHLEYESTDYLIAIRRHYRTNQIYKLSQDANTVIERFLSSIKIRVGYSTVLAWVAFILTIIDGILLLFTCRITHNYDVNETNTTLLSLQKEDNHSPLQFSAMPDDSRFPPPPPVSVMNNFNENSQSLRVQFDDEV